MSPDDDRDMPIGGWPVCRMMAAALVLLGTLSGSPVLAEENDELQANCAQQAEKEFHREGWNVGLTSRNEGNSDVRVSFQSHYNTKLNTCFLFVKTDGVGRQNTGSQFRRLLNADDAWIYANYFEKPRDDKEDGAIPLMCRITPSRTEELPCKSEADFKQFVAQYMEE